MAQWHWKDYWPEDDHDIDGDGDNNGDGGGGGDDYDQAHWSMAIGRGCWPEMGMPDAEVQECNAVQWIFS